MSDAKSGHLAIAEVETAEAGQIGSKSDIDPAIKLLADVMHLWVDGYISKNPHSAAPASICNTTFDDIERFLDTHEISVDYMGWEVKQPASAKSEEQSAAEWCGAIDARTGWQCHRPNGHDGLHRHWFPYPYASADWVDAEVPAVPAQGDGELPPHIHLGEAPPLSSFAEVRQERDLARKKLATMTADRDRWEALSELQGVALATARERISELELDLKMREATLTMTVARLGGMVEGRPTALINFLQRIDELVTIERTYAAAKASGE